MAPDRKTKRINKRTDESIIRTKQYRNKNQGLPNLELKGLKIQSIKGPLSLKELQYCIRSKYKGILRSKRCETAYLRYLRTKPMFINKNDQSRKIRLNNYPYNLH